MKPGGAERLLRRGPTTRLALCAHEARADGLRPPHRAFTALYPESGKHA